MYSFNVTLEKPAPDGLSGATWRFLLLGMRLVLEDYVEWQKPSKRHGKRVLRKWSRFDQRSNTVAQEKVPFNDEIAAEAKSALLAQMQEQVTVGLRRKDEA